MSDDALSWVRILTMSLSGEMVPSGFGHQGPQQIHLPAGSVLLGWSSCDVQLPDARCPVLPSPGSGALKREL